MDAPSAVSVAMCIAHMMQPKPEDRLSPGRWPMYGRPVCILVDNGKDFRSQALQRGCEQHGIQLRWRPVRTPHYGAHIERLMGTFMRMVHTLPGTTFSNVKARGDYRSEETACFTLEDFRAWLVERICHTYHVSRHRTLGEPPLIAWERSFRNEDGTLRTPPLPAGADTLRSDFYPFEYRRMQRTGVQFQCSRYWNDALAPLVHPERQLAVHYHPNDTSRVWVRTEEGALIEALPVAGRAVQEERRVALSAQDTERLDALKAEGYAESDAIKERAQGRARQQPSSNRKKRKVAGAGARPSSTRERPKPPPNRASIRVEVLDV
jgi:putative transposase